MRGSFKLLKIVLLLLVVTSCSNCKSELDKLQQYYIEKGDMQKIKAVDFILKNIEHHYSYDTTNLSVFREILFDLDSLRKSNGDVSVIYDKWRNIASLRNTYAIKYDDTEHVTFEYLRDNIEYSFDIWKRNPFADTTDFDRFCNFILPYKMKQGMAIEDWKKGYDKELRMMLQMDTSLTIVEVVDSILNTHKDIMRGLVGLDNYPYIKLSDIKLSRQGSCDMGSIYNSMEFAALGISVAVDVVPAWGNRNASHTWNTLIHNDKEYSFDPFYEPNRWGYKELYNNKSSHPDWGKFRLPKVYRRTFAANLTDLHHDEEGRNIPPFFRNKLQKDVSSHYFDASDVIINIPEKIGAINKFVWLCVFNRGFFTPVSWAKIIDGKATFEGVGRDILYFTATYSNNEIMAFGDAIHIDHNGVQNNIVPSEKKEEIKLNRKYPHFNFNLPKMYQSLESINIESNGKNIDFKRSDSPPCGILFEFAEKVKKNRVKITIHDSEIEYYHKNIAEILFYDEERNIVKCKYDSLLAPMFDGDDLTYCTLASATENKNAVITVDTEKDIAYMEMIVRNDRNYIYAGLLYELFYWNQAWKSLGNIVGTNSSELVFDNIPENAVLWLRCLSEGREERPFMYKNGRQIWL